MPKPHEIERHRAMQRPARWLLALELRALAELGSILPVWPWLQQRTPRGDEHPVLVVPGLLAGDSLSSLNPVPHDGDDDRGDGAPPVPATSIYSRSDCVVGWDAAALGLPRRARLTSRPQFGAHP
jgi:hypothetical protein